MERTIQRLLIDYKVYMNRLKQLPVGSPEFLQAADNLNETAAMLDLARKKHNRNIPDRRFGDWCMCENKIIRFRALFHNAGSTGFTREYEFEIFKRPWLFGMVGKKRWTHTITTNSFIVGLKFSCHLLKIKYKKQ